MADEDASSTSAAGSRTRNLRPAPTIELTATDVSPASSAAAPDAAAPESAAQATGETRPSDSRPPEPDTMQGDMPAAAGAAGGPPTEPSPGPDLLPGNGNGPNAPPPRRTGSHVAAGLAGGAVVALALLGLWLSDLLPVHNPAQDPLAPRIAMVEQQVRSLSARPPAAAPDARPLQELEGRVAKLESAPPPATAAPAAASPAAPDPALAKRVDDIETAGRSLASELPGLTARIDELGTAVQDARARADAAAASAETVQSASRGAAAVDERALAELSQRIAVVEASARTAADLAARMPALENGAKAAAELSPRVAAIETGVKSIQADLAKQAAAQAAGDRAARFAVATGALNAAVERGTPFATEFAAVKPLAPNAGALAPLESVASRGVPGVEALARELAALIPAIQRAAGSPNQDGSVLERLQANAERLVRIRRVEETPGDDPAAVVSRIEAKAAQQDVDGALAELAKLPPAARAPAEDWIKKAQSRRAALEQSRRLHADALAALGKP